MDECSIMLPLTSPQSKLPATEFSIEIDKQLFKQFPKMSSPKSRIFWSQTMFASHCRMMPGVHTSSAKMMASALVSVCPSAKAVMESNAT